MAYFDIQEKYGRRLHIYIAGLDQMAIAGRTNDIDRACKRFGKDFFLSYEESAVSNFNDLACDTFDSSESQMTNTIHNH